MISTIEWATSLGVSTEKIPSALEIVELDFPRTARDVAVRAVILHGVIAVACEIDPEPVIEWFHDYELWSDVSPRERTFLLDPLRLDNHCNVFRWQQEAQWALLWMIGKHEALGLPTCICDTRYFADGIIPCPGSDITDFIESSELRPADMLIAEDSRTCDLWCYAVRDRRQKRTLPHDLSLDILYQRRNAFEWLDSLKSWDQVIGDATI